MNAEPKHPAEQLRAIAAADGPLGVAELLLRLQVAPGRPADLAPELDDGSIADALAAARASLLEVAERVSLIDAQRRELRSAGKRQRVARQGLERRLAKAEAAGYQGRVGVWMDACFPRALYGDTTQRCDRFLEEALELLQAQGYDRARVATLLDYVWSRPVGEPAQEVGGTMVTLAALCFVAGIDMHGEAWRELERIERPEVMAKIRAKQEAKNALRFDSPLPGCVAEPAIEAAA